MDDLLETQMTHDAVMAESILGGKIPANMNVPPLPVGRPRRSIQPINTESISEVVDQVRSGDITGLLGGIGMAAFIGAGNFLKETLNPRGDRAPIGALEGTFASVANER